MIRPYARQAIRDSNAALLKSSQVHPPTKTDPVLGFGLIQHCSIPIDEAFDAWTLMDDFAASRRSELTLHSTTEVRNTAEIATRAATNGGRVRGPVHRFQPTPING